MSQPIVILGAVGNCLDILDAVLAVNSSVPGTWEVIGFLDDGPSRQGSSIRNVPVLGPLAAVRDLPDAQFVSGIGSPRSYRNKKAVIARLGLDRERFVTVIHPTTVVSRSATIGNGCVLLGNCTICANVRFGDHVMMLPNCVVGHDTRIGDYSTFAAGVITSGSISIGRSCYLGAGSCIRDSVRIGDGALLGMGAVLVNDAPAGAVMAGNPAKPMRKPTTP